MTDLDLGIIAARGGEWADLAAEVLSLRERVPCTCATYYAVYEGPEEDCPEHGRTYAEWVERVDRLAETNARYRVSTDAVRALCEQRIAEHADYVRGVQDGTLITLDRFIGPAQVDVADVLAALDVRHDPSATTDGGAS